MRGAVSAMRLCDMLEIMQVILVALVHGGESDDGFVGVRARGNANR